MAASKPTRVAVTQAEPVWLDLDGTITKTIKFIAEAASNGAKLVTFPECWVPGYPAWIWSVLRFTTYRSKTDISGLDQLTMI